MNAVLLAQAGVVSNAPAVPRQLQDIRGPLDLALVAPWVVRGLLVAVPLAILAWVWWRRKPTGRAAAQVRETAAARARSRLSESWGLLDRPEPFCTLLSEIVRVYLEERFGLRAPDQTTEEFLEGLRESLALDLRHKELLRDFMFQCDLVKFARGEPERADLERLHQMASALVDETGVESRPSTRPEAAGKEVSR